MFLFSEYFTPLNAFYDFLDQHGLTILFYNNAIYFYIILLILLTVGFVTRGVSFVALILQLLIFRSFNELNYGFDQFMTMSLFYSFIFPSGRFYSIDHLLFKYRAPAYNFDYSRIIAIHLCIVYFFSGIAKVFDPNWWSGGALWRAISSVYNDYFKLTPMLLAICGVAIVLLESCYPLLVSIKRTRAFAIGSIISMHIGIAVILWLYSFAMIMIVWNIGAFYYFGKSKKLTGA